MRLCAKNSKANNNDLNFKITRDRSTCVWNYQPQPRLAEILRQFLRPPRIKGYCAQVKCSGLFSVLMRSGILKKSNRRRKLKDSRAIGLEESRPDLTTVENSQTNLCVYTCAAPASRAVRSWINNTIEQLKQLSLPFYVCSASS